MLYRFLITWSVEYQTDLKQCIRKTSTYHLDFIWCMRNKVWSNVCTTQNQVHHNWHSKNRWHIWTKFLLWIISLDILLIHRYEYIENIWKKHRKTITRSQGYKVSRVSEDFRRIYRQYNHWVILKSGWLLSRFSQQSKANFQSARTPMLSVGYYAAVAKSILERQFKGWD